IFSMLSTEEIKNLVITELNVLKGIPLDTVMYGKDLLNQVLKDHVESFICYTRGKKGQQCIEIQEPTVYVYKLTAESAATETMENGGSDLPISFHWILPAKEFHYLWENLYFEPGVKENLLNFVETAMIFSEHKVNSNIINCNKVVLLHGPPGSGKTSLCKALAQKMTIVLGNRFTHGELVEINSHSLFSKWFSESGKLVMQLFSELRHLLENPQALVCILIDEVETLAHARKACSNGIEPTDSIRVVNALLTQLDQIKQYPNVLILTTSNLSEAIDLAFIDRADIKQYIGQPSNEAIYHIYHSCLTELMRTKLVEEEKTSELENIYSKLKNLSRMSAGLSGRSLRKIPFLTYAFHLQNKQCTLKRFLSAMYVTIIEQKKSDLFIDRTRKISIHSAPSNDAEIKDADRLRR
ncbi:Pachytene checkpoint protein 2 like protein, partial [Habropoda laboriosa]